jgi:hypothetical protein
LGFQGDKTLLNEARYVPGLIQLLTECEANYARLLKLLPEMGQITSRQLAVTYPNEQVVHVQLDVVEVFRYTSTVRIQQCSDAGKWLQVPCVVVRLYHDARMAEVVDGQHTRQFKGFYGYPNTQMHQVDEKVQRNLYLAQWLCYCLQHGHVSESVSAV